MSENWDNTEQLPMRTKLAVRLLLLAVKILSPYKFEHRFEEEFKEINELLSLPKPKETE